ncbi:hypothetical protein E1211_25735 [Micromonospora sp. 15K316]|uniref:hypothetical protein n=1 Tax=Micromonospora sp. 15K316 TaxID=2530376 RepID=UPI0010522556|nr:hypothetical protein [Micromonospora sp. 15K316]TDC29622.1 hypothetical protein E1211_25735 [Micromonospora sp. 15K316]
MTEPRAVRSPGHRPEPRPPRRRALPVVTLTLGLLLAGCPGSSSDPGEPSAGLTAGGASGGAAPAGATATPVDVAVTAVTDDRDRPTLVRFVGLV